MKCTTCGAEGPLVPWDLLSLEPPGWRNADAVAAGWNPFKRLCAGCTACVICSLRVAPGQGVPRLGGGTFAAHYRCIDHMDVIERLGG